MGFWRRPGPPATTTSLDLAPLLTSMGPVWHFPVVSPLLGTAGSSLGAERLVRAFAIPANSPGHWLDRQDLNLHLRLLG